MSDFDKEAEREKLRKKYEQEQADREATQRMSDLLLKGARMTNTHCGTCGDPLFEQNGTTFCPSCHGGPEGVEASIEDGNEPGSSSAGTSKSGAATSQPADSPAPKPGADTPAPEPDENAADESDDGVASASEPQGGPADPDPEAVTADPTIARTNDEGPSRSESPRNAEAPSTSRQASAPPATGASEPGVDGDLDAGHDALVAALERFAQAAAETDDPRYARDCLQAAREAAEALDALR
ncbi:hypothetical protein OB905_07920 [Halobacteria archaeon AArc-dxtr1]|nr:hypothetical protein [Halobacteria archaeon AArc-dxtr1]